jgi:hypothetical protein
VIDFQKLIPHQNSHKIASKYIFDEYFLQKGIEVDIFDENDEILMKDKHLIVS